MNRIPIGGFTAEQLKEMALFVGVVISMFCMIWFGGVVPLAKELEERATWESRAAAKRWMAECEQERQADETGYVIRQTMKEILK